MDDRVAGPDDAAAPPRGGPLAVSLVEVVSASPMLVDGLARQSIRASSTQLGEPTERLVLVVLPAGLDDSTVRDRVRRLSAAGARRILGWVPDGDSSDAERCLAAGFDDVMAGRESVRELAGRLHALARRQGRPGAENGLRFGTIMVDPRQHRVWISGHPVVVTRTEMLLMAELVAAHGQCRSRLELLEAVWGDAAAECSERAVDNALMRLRQKLPDPSLIETVRGVGFRLRMG